MADPFIILLTTAATLGIVHPALGVDHVVPFVVLAHARKWSIAQTLGMTALCGVGHVLSSVVIASGGLALGVATSQLEWIEATRGSWAAALLIGFGLAYAAIAYWKSRNHRFSHLASAGATHHHGATDLESFSQPGIGQTRVISALFIIFVLGPCEALLPLLTASGLTLTAGEATLVGALFCGATLATMLVLVAVGYLGLRASGLSQRDGWLHTHAHTLAGFSMALSGVAIQVLGV